MKTINTNGFNLPKYSCRKCYSQDHYVKEKGQHLGLYCSNCNAWITWLSKPLDDYEIYFGKYKGKKLKEINTRKLTLYYKFISSKDLNKSQRKCMSKVRQYLEEKGVRFS